MFVLRFGVEAIPQEEYRGLVSLLLELLKARFGERLVSVVVFGSVGRGAAKPESDVDVLVVSSTVPRDAVERARLKMRLREALGVSAPLEIHLATPEEFEGWYRMFIDVYEEF